MTAIKSHLPAVELEHRYKTASEAIAKSHFHALWLLARGYSIDQVAGLYDSDTKKMCIPSFTHETTTNRAKANEKQLEKLGPTLDNIVLAHEFTHALEDQYWPIDDSKDEEEGISTDRGTAHSFLLEGSATRAMAEAVPAQSAGRSAGTYFFMWHLLHSGPGEFALKYALLDAWKSSDSLVEGVPDTLSRMETLPYSFGYAFSTDILRNWGLDGLDYIYDHRPISSEQISCTPRHSPLMATNRFESFFTCKHIRLPGARR